MAYSSRFLLTSTQSKTLPSTLKIAAGLFEEVVAEAAVDGLAGDVGLVVCPFAEESLVPGLVGDLRVVLDVGILDADDRQAETRLRPVATAATSGPLRPRASGARRAARRRA